MASIIKTVDGMISSSDVHEGFLRGANKSLIPVKYYDIGGFARCEGCMVLGTMAEMNMLANAVAENPALRQDDADFESFGITISGLIARWKDGVVPFRVRSDLPNSDRVKDAIAHWKDRKTGIEFVERTFANRDQFPDFVTFMPGDGCAAQVGRQGGEQFIWLGSGCTVGNTIHEIGHCLGLFHEQSREDRDDFIDIDFDNIVDAARHNFDQHITDGDDVGGYDYGSIMHYPKNAFAKDPSKPTIVTKNGEEIGQRVGLSDGDVATIKAIYGA